MMVICSVCGEPRPGFESLASMLVKAKAGFRENGHPIAGLSHGFHASDELESMLAGQAI